MDTNLMNKNKFFASLLVFLLAFFSASALADVKGIYLTQLTAQKKDTVEYLIENAKAVGIGTFVVDYDNPNKAYARNIALIKDSGIRYVARIVIFPGGATPEQIDSKEYLAKKLALINQAIELGADEIQLDYIRYKPTQKPSDKNAEKIAGVITYFKDNMDKKIPLQIDVFGISTFKPSLYIGQNLELFSQHVDAINPMVYPSHYEPYLIHARQPYKTIFDSLTAMKKQIDADEDLKIYAYIELFNYRYPMSHAKRQDYIRAQMKAVKDAGANGWYAWSAGNHYDILFEVLKKSQLAQNDYAAKADNNNDSRESNSATENRNDSDDKEVLNQDEAPVQ